MNDTTIETWSVASTELTDGSYVYDVIGTSDEARVVINCHDWNEALALEALLNKQPGASAERV